MATLGAHHSRLVSERKRALLGGLEGRVLEIGPGGGVNFEFYAATVTEWIGVEPNPYAHDRLRAVAAEHRVPARLLDGGAESIALPDESVDAVVSTLVLCSVGDQRAALAEVHRVLRPGGRFVFVEHVAAPRGTLLRRVQRLVRAPWRVAGGGCEPDRETWHAVEQAGFRRVTLDHFRVGLPVVSPHVAGVAER
ncbi:MAG: methyltransferase domain-containing protein [Gemmatimonadaceae bacterium]|nr:methyltransferase domain-containing protein [Gemmatimonadaceae bacterium]